MSKTQETKKSLKSRIESIKKINDEPNESIGSLSNAYKNNIPDPDEFIGSKLDNIKNNRKKQKKDNKNDIFSDLIEITEQFVTTSKKTKSDLGGTLKTLNPNKIGTDINVDKNPVKSKIKRHSISATKTTLGQSKEIVIKRLSEALFMGEGICGSESLFTVDSITLSPDEFDFLDIFTIDPDSSCGQLIYEKKSPDKGKQKTNRSMYDLFDGNTTYTYTSNNGTDLFTTTWSATTQQFVFTGLTQGIPNFIKVQDFIQNYYGSLEFPSIDDVINQSMLMTIQGGTSCANSNKFNVSFNKTLRLINKLLTVCGSDKNKDELKNQTPVDMFDEDEEDIEFYFDFDDVEGIDLDDEELRFKRVLRFKDCYNFEIPVDDMHIEDFIYLSNNNGAINVIDSTLENVATDAFEQSDGSLSISDFANNLLNNFILNLPKALLMTILSAKVFLPLVILYKIFKIGITNVIINIKDLVKKFYKAIGKIVSDLFWLFIREFWKLVKIDLVSFVSKIVQKIIKNKYKRYLLIITSLILLLRKVLDSGLDNCYDLFRTILSTIETALSARTPISVPSILLLFSSALPGYSQDRAFMNIMNRLEAAGVPTGPLYGDSNDIGNLVKSIIDGHTEEEDTNSFVKIVLQGGVLPGPPLAGGAIIPPGIISGVGKKF
jgi:hypothetical protein